MKFICDAMLGRLARYLRMLGLDAPYVVEGDINDALADTNTDFYIFTRRESLKKHPSCVLIRTDHVMSQLREIREVIVPYLRKDNAMTRCILCNMPLEPEEKINIEQMVPEYVYHHFSEFYVCPQCRRVYWRGSHARHMERLLTEIEVKTR